MAVVEQNSWTGERTEKRDKGRTKEKGHYLTDCSIRPPESTGKNRLKKIHF